MNGDNKLALGLAVLALLVGGGALIFALVARGQLDDERRLRGEWEGKVSELERELSEIRGLEETLRQLQEEGAETARWASGAAQQVEAVLNETERAVQGVARRFTEQLQAQRRDLGALARTVADIEERVGDLESSTPAPADSRPTAPDRGDGQRVHTIESGDTYSALARTYGVRVRDLEEANPDVDPRRLRVGQEIIIP